MFRLSSRGRTRTGSYRACSADETTCSERSTATPSQTQLNDLRPASSFTSGSGGRSQLATQHRQTDRQTTGHAGRVTSPGARKAPPAPSRQGGRASRRASARPGRRPLFIGLFSPTRRDAADRAYQTAGAKHQITVRQCWRHLVRLRTLTIRSNTATNKRRPTVVKRRESHWLSSVTIRLLSRVRFWSPPNWTSVTPASFVFNRWLSSTGSIVIIIIIIIIVITYKFIQRHSATT